MKAPLQPSLFSEVGSPPGLRPGSVKTESDLASLALALGARQVSGWTDDEERLVAGLPPAPTEVAEWARQRIDRGEDPLGETFCVLRTPAERRKRGATYTPLPIVRMMFDWAAVRGGYARVVDPGAGSGRFLVEAAARYPRAELVGVELDPLAALLARANLAVRGITAHSRVELCDYRALALDRTDGRTLFIGNPPYVRHHLIEPYWKQWLVEQARRYGIQASQLAGTHAHFYLATATKAIPGDAGVFITSAEWLDVNYGNLVRELLLGPLGARRIAVFEPTSTPFADAATTAVITAFDVGVRPSSVTMIRAASVRELSRPESPREIGYERLEAEPRWSHLTRGGRPSPEGLIELGEICRVHRGQVTGHNRVWIEGPHSADLPGSVLFASVTKARELFAAGVSLDDPAALKRVIDLPVDLDTLEPEDRARVERFLHRARALGADRGYVATNRKAWWSVGLREPAPILATYMARRPPAFVCNGARARHLNIAHGLYPREPLSERMLAALAAYLSRSISVADGRTYAGGLVKFEPREMERLLVPRPELLVAGFA
jgi:adenine-specific DNA-methyltransferase